jgi:cephalosporin hydroxylase
LLWEIQPDLLIETGTAGGGSAFYYATLMDLIGTGHVLTMDIYDHGPPKHPRVTHLAGYSSTEPTLVTHVQQIARRCERVMVILDSDHRAGHVLQELNAYAPLVSVGSLVLVEDTMLAGHPIDGHHLPGAEGPGPTEAVDLFLTDHPEFERDRRCERFEITYHPGGFLRRVSA